MATINLYYTEVNFLDTELYTNCWCIVADPSFCPSPQYVSSAHMAEWLYPFPGGPGTMFNGFIYEVIIPSGPS